MAYVMYQWTLERELYLGNVYTGFAGKGKKALAKRSTLVVNSYLASDKQHPVVQDAENVGKFKEMF